jgi:hypothetical protein
MKTNKTCNKCNERKSIFEFYEKMFAKDGYENRCKECHKARTAERHKERKAGNALYREQLRVKQQRHNAKRKQNNLQQLSTGE